MFNRLIWTPHSRLVFHKLIKIMKYMRNIQFILNDPKLTYNNNNVLFETIQE